MNFPWNKEMESSVMKTCKSVTTACLLGAALVATTVVSAKDRTSGRGTGPVVFVTSQGLYYDSIVLTDLPMKGNFQQLIPGENGLSTEFGPGEAGHLGGRWWIDSDEIEGMSAGDMYFLCPLLGPGRETM
jgi:hypothetical protein